MKLCWIALALLPLAAHADVKVDFVNPEKFSDIRDNTGFTDKAVLKDIEAYLVAQFGKRMPGRDVHISVTDVNLAGEIEPVGGMARWLRVMRTITSPSMELTYEIRDGEKVVQQGMSKLRDIDYQNGFSSLSSSDPLRYEKHMMDRWMDREFSRTVAPGSPEGR
jgi:hypothetical protein